MNRPSKRKPILVDRSELNKLIKDVLVPLDIKTGSLICGACHEQTPHTYHDKCGYCFLGLPRPGRDKPPSRPS